MSAELAQAEFEPSERLSRRSSNASEVSLATASKRRTPTVTEEDVMLREQVCRQIFGEDIACIVKDFSCAWDNRQLMHGRMYLTSDRICFYSNWFGFESTLTIPYKGITRCNKGNSALFIPNAIIIHEGPDKSYVFRNFWERDECFGIIQRFVNEAAAACDHSAAAAAASPAAAAAETPTAASTPNGSPETSGRRRQRSGPPSLDASNDGGSAAASPPNLPAEASRAAHQQGATRSQRGSLTPPPTASKRSGHGSSSATESESSEDVTQSLPSSPVAPARNGERWNGSAHQHRLNANGGTAAAAAGAAASSNRPPLPRARSRSGDNHVVAAAGSSPAANGGAKATGNAGVVTAAAAAGASAVGNGDAAAAFSSALAAPRGAHAAADGGSPQLLEWEDASEAEAEPNRAAFEEAVEKEATQTLVTTAEFPVSVRDFWMTFMADGAPYGLPDFHLTRGDWEVDPSVWQASPEAQGVVRSIRFKTPLNISFMVGPSQVRTLKKQRARSFGSAGLVIDTVTTVEDRIPLSDHFCVEDRWVLQPAADGERCRVTVKWRCNWLRFTVLKGLIEAKCKGEVRAFNESFVRGMADYLAGAAPMISRERSRTVMGLGGRSSLVTSSVYDDMLPDSVKVEISRARRVLTPFAAPVSVATFFFLCYTVIFWVSAMISEAPAGPPPPVQLQALYAEWGRSNLVLQGVHEQIGVLATQTGALRQELAAGNKAFASGGGGQGAAALAAAAMSKMQVSLAAVDASAGALREEARVASAAIASSTAKIHSLLVDLSAQEVGN